MKRDNSGSGLEKKFKELDEGKSQSSQQAVDTGSLGKKGFYGQKEETPELGKSGHYKKADLSLSIPPVVSENPAIIFILLLAIGAISYFVFFYSPPVTTGKFEVLVFSGEARLPGASVTVYDGQNALQTTTTDSYGKAVFANLPNKPLRFTVSSGENVVEKVVNPTGRRVYSFNVQGSVLLASDSITLTILDKDGQLPIAGVKVAYSLGSNTTKYFAESDASGKAVLDLQGETIIRLRIVDPQRRYDAESLTLLANREVMPILLSRREAGTTTLEGGGEVQVASVTLLVRDEAGNAVNAGGQVNAFYAFTGASAGNAVIANGEAQVENLAIGASVSFTVQVAGFYPVSSGEVQVAENNQPVVVTLQAIPPQAAKTRLFVTSNSVPVNAVVYLFQPGGNATQFASTTVQDGVAEFTLDPDAGAYYSLVKAPAGFLPFTTSEFTSAADVNVELIPLSAETSGNLEVNVVDEDSNSLIGASVAVLNVDGFLLDLPSASDFAGQAKFTLPLGATVIVRAAVEPLHGNDQEIQIDSNTAVTLTVLSHAAFLDLQVLDVADNRPVNEVTLTSFYNGKTYQTCSGNGGCVVSVRGASDVAVQIDAAGYLPYTYYGEEIAELEPRQASVHLIPASLASGTKVELISVEDGQGNVLSGNVLRPGTYNAKFFASTTTPSSTLSFYVRVGDNRQNGTLASVHLLEPLSTSGVDVAKSITYLGSRPQCDDLLNPVFDPPYKWVELTFANTSSQEINIPFEIPTSVNENSSFSLEFRSKATSEVNGDVNVRYPADSVLGFAAASAQKANCYAATVKADFVVSSLQQPLLAEQSFPEIEGRFTSGDGLVFDPVQRKLKSQNGLTSYELQVDSILPADAMPLLLQSDQQCVVLVSQPNSTNVNPTSSCYFYDNLKSMLVFESAELNPACPIHLKGDKFYNANGTRVNKDSVKLAVLASCSPEVNLEIPINVNFVSDVSSLAVKPDGDNLGEGDASKLLYVVNNRQLQSRNIDVTFQNTVPYQLAGASSKPLAWRGPGTLEISENGDLVQEVIIENRSSAFKSGIGVLSHRQTSCASGDVYCCSNGWCTRKALEDFVPSFKETASRVAKSTAFRRQNGQPFSYFSQFPFKFVTVVQAAQGAQTALTVEGVNFSSPLTCVPGNPGVYQLTASSTSGLEDSWNYSANTLQLRQSDYIQRPLNCGGGSNATQVSLTSTNGETALCNFLSTKNNCIESTRNASITSIDQVETLNFELTNCMYPVFPSAPVCPGTKMILPAVNIGNYRSSFNFDPADSPNAFQKIFTAISDSNRSSFSAFSWQGQLKCIVPPSFQQFGITTASLGLDKVPDYANEDAKAKQSTPIRSDICSRSDFFNLGVVPNLDTIIPLAGVCCPGSVSAEVCTARRGKFFISVKDNSVKIITSWGLTEGCYPYWPFPTTLHGLLQKQNVVSVAFGLTEFLTSNGANFEMSLASEVPGEKAAASTGLSSVPCNGDVDCSNYEQCSLDTIYRYSGGKCVGKSSGSNGVCSFSSVSSGTACSGGQQCKQTDKTALCQECGADGQACCLNSDGNAFCKAGVGCVVEGSRTYCTSVCGNKATPLQPVCGGWNSEPLCTTGTRTPPKDDLLYSTCR